MRRTAMLVVRVLFVLLLPTSALAQAENIPADVVALISRLGNSVGADAELRPGGPPASFPADTVPSGTVVNASLISPSRGTTIVATAEGLSLTQVEQHWDGLTAEGWSVVPGAGASGFTSSQAASMRTWTLCRGVDLVLVSVSPREAGGFHLRLTRPNDPERPCVPAGMGAMADVRVPGLTPPEGSRLLGPVGRIVSGGVSATTTTRLETSLAASEVALHYERQLVAAGWTVVTRLQDSDEAAVVRFEVPSKAGPPLTGWLSVFPLGIVGGRDMDLLLRVVRNAREEPSLRR